MVLKEASPPSPSPLFWSIPIAHQPLASGFSKLALPAGCKQILRAQSSASSWLTWTCFHLTLACGFQILLNHISTSYPALTPPQPCHTCSIGDIFPACSLPGSLSSLASASLMVILRRKSILMPFPKTHPLLQRFSRDLIGQGLSSALTLSLGLLCIAIYQEPSYLFFLLYSLSRKVPHLQARFSELCPVCHSTPTPSFSCSLVSYCSATYSAPWLTLTDSGDGSMDSFPALCGHCMILKLHVFTDLKKQTLSNEALLLFLVSFLTAELKVLCYMEGEG